MHVTALAEGCRAAWLGRAELAELRDGGAGSELEIFCLESGWTIPILVLDSLLYIADAGLLLLGHMCSSFVFLTSPRPVD